MGEILRGRFLVDTPLWGKAKDVCKGGQGNDTASACEIEKSI